MNTLNRLNLSEKVQLIEAYSSGTVRDLHPIPFCTPAFRIEDLGTMMPMLTKIGYNFEERSVAIHKNEATLTYTKVRVAPIKSYLDMLGQAAKISGCDLLGRQSFVHCLGSLAAIAHSEDYSSSTTHDVATCIDYLEGGFIVVVDLDSTPLGDHQALDRAWDQRIGFYTYAYDHFVYGNIFGLADYFLRTTTPRLVGLAKFHHLQAHATNTSLLVGKVLDRIVQGQKLHPFFFGVLYLLEASRHLLFATTINDHGTLGS